MRRDNETRPANTIQIFLKHHNDPDGKYTPKQKTCSDYEDGKGHLHKGCGGTVFRYVTYPRERGMYFDSAPIIVQQFPPRSDGAVIALVSNENVHHATCPAKKQTRETSADFKTAAANAAHNQ